MEIQSSRFISRLTPRTLALILAGGRGSRLGILTNWRAKPAVPFGGKFRIIDFSLSNCLNSDIRKICVLTQYKSHSLIRHLLQGWGTLNTELGEFVELIPAQQWIDEGSWFQGTADAVYQSLDIIESHNPEYILILAGDHVYKMDYGEMLAAHVASKADFTIACNTVSLKEARSFGVISVDDSNRIRSFREKPASPKPMPSDPDSALVSMGIYVFSQDYLAEQLHRDADLMDSSHDFGKDIIPYAINSGHHVQAYPFHSPSGDKEHYWRDVGTIDAYYQANLELTAAAPPLDLYDLHWPILTYQQQLPPAKFIRKGYLKAGSIVDTTASGGCIVHSSYLDKTLLFSNVKVHENCELRGVMALPDCEIESDVRLHKVILDNGCHVPSGTIIGENPEQDAQRYHRTAGGIVVVNREMLGQQRQYLPEGSHHA